MSTNVLNQWVFSKDEAIISEKKNRLKPKNVQKLGRPTNS